MIESDDTLHFKIKKKKGVTTTQSGYISLSLVVSEPACMFPIHVRIVARMVLHALILLALMSFFNYIDYTSLVLVRQVLALTAARCI